MAISPRPARTTRLSSGSVQKRSYIDEDSSSSEEEATSLRASAKGRGRPSASSQKASASKSAKVEKQRRKKYADSEEDSASDFVDHDASESSDAGAVDVTEDDDETTEGEEPYPARKKGSGKAKSRTKGKARSSAGTQASSPSNAKRKSRASEDEKDEVTQIVRAPSAPIPSDWISPHTLRFMTDLQDPAKNDREWFAVHKNVYDWIHQNWLNFTEASVDVMIERVDDTVAWMPPKALIERIYRDVRFSNDKTPYKRHLSWCMSRNGKKGSYAKYYFSLMGNDKSGLYAGVHEASKEDLDTIRSHVLNKTSQGRALQLLVKDAAFSKYFGAPPKSAKDTRRTSLWNADDELKRAPKGYEPDHPDVQWLRLKSYTVQHHFTDEEVTSPNFFDRLVEVAQAAQRLVAITNEMLHGSLPQMPANALQ